MKITWTNQERNLRHCLLQSDNSWIVCDEVEKTDCSYNKWVLDSVSQAAKSSHQTLPLKYTTIEILYVCTDKTLILIIQNICTFSAMEVCLNLMISDWTIELNNFWKASIKVGIFECALLLSTIFGKNF